jgi:hypothetical protein
MKSLNLNFKFWLAGVIAGVILMERWRRYGARSARAGDAVAASTTSSEKPKASSLIVAGAKADAERAKRLLKQPTP